MDVKALDAELQQDETIADIVIYKKDGSPYLAADGTPSTVGVTGTDADAYRKEKHAIQRELLSSRRTKLDPEDLTRNRIRQAAAGVKRWHGWEDDDEELKCERNNVRAVCKIEHILEQIEAGIAGHASFFSSNSNS